MNPWPARVSLVGLSVKAVLPGSPFHGQIVINPQRTALIQSETVTPINASAEQVSLVVEVNLTHPGRYFRIEKTAP